MTNIIRLKRIKDNEELKTDREHKKDKRELKRQQLKNN
jgi:hypothetical protein